MQNDERVNKLKAVLQGLWASPAGRAQLEAALDGCGLKAYRQVEKQVFPVVTDPERLAKAKPGVFLDTETTGVDVTQDKVIQLAMRRFTYDDQGVLSVGEVFDRFRDPGMPIPEEVVKLTHITDEDVRGKVIEDSEVAAFVELDKNPLIVCHNAGFDRKILELNFPSAGFEKLNFDCSFEQVDWGARGFSSGKLELLALHAGYVYGAHNALNDIDVMPLLLNLDHRELGTPFSEMRAAGEQASILLVAQGSPFAAKDALKARGYRWSPDGAEAAGHSKSWYRVLADDPQVLAEEGEFLKTEIYQRDVELPAFRISGNERYSARKPSQREFFRTAEVRRVVDAVSQKNAPVEGDAVFTF